MGTSGWNYAHWRGAWYPAALPPARWLGYLASRLSSVEVNGTFYSLTTPRACDRWRAAVPEDFVFAVKGSRYITHMKRLRDARTALANFFASGILRLGAQLGPILWQLPPNLRFDREGATDFFDLLPPDVAAAEKLARRHDARTTGRSALTAPDGRDARIRYAVEARHDSWMGEEALDFLRSRRIGLVWADTAGEHPSAVSQTAPDLAYVRLHGSRRIYEGRYTEDELLDWSLRCRAWAAAGARVFVYFDNDRDGAAAADAEHLAALVGGREPVRREPGAEALDASPRERPAHFGFARR